mmetsp:Transcript_84774/g.203223  ORF Transcript_84774/g.203223 Transcript_84774/m.203223 type:complete len:158 (-) Transcript_84774:319-792(-)
MRCMVDYFLWFALTSRHTTPGWASKLCPVRQHPAVPWRQCHSSQGMFHQQTDSRSHQGEDQHRPCALRMHWRWLSSRQELVEPLKLVAPPGQESKQAQVPWVWLAAERQDDRRNRNRNTPARIREGMAPSFRRLGVPYKCSFQLRHCRRRCCCGHSR